MLEYKAGRKHSHEVSELEIKQLCGVHVCSCFGFIAQLNQKLINLSVRTISECFGIFRIRWLLSS